ncbi:type II toxin-antitoxin system antitoxin SocA domain-containing protein [Marispirochaeta aestuarii]|uniref:type II toxin-antitoxin system antitoxin SocA domain-containing protein n=1 Tax=Marispirochaeta aestuarii TaxID=1963862 RepID=UPI002ABD3CAD|nr:type II toxin-antitoxin system antitoxin SocA domain-containing protein [Marispirochaeta aestuarii]
MIAYRQERIDNAIAYFAKRHREITNKPAFKTYIFKYLALFDFSVLRETGVPAFDFSYDALQRGPVPRELYYRIDQLESEKYTVSEDQDGNHYFTETGDAELDFFSEREIEQLQKIAESYMRPGMKTDDVCDATHHDIKAWRVAWENRGTRNIAPMQYMDEFDDILSKSEDELEPEEEAYLIHQGLQIAGNFDDRFCN